MFFFQRAVYTAQQNAQYSSQPWNTVIVFVPQQEAWVIERFGRYKKILEPVSELFAVLWICYGLFTRIQTQTPNPMTTLYCTETFHITQT